MSDLGHDRGEMQPLGALVDLIERALKEGDASTVESTDVQRIMAAAIRLYTAAAAAGNPLIPVQSEAVTPTEVLTAVCALLRALDLNLFDLAMWFNRGTVREE